MATVRAPDGSKNVGREVRDALERIVGTVRAQDVLAWIAAWLAAESYRTRFDEGLRIEPARVPLPRSSEEWQEVTVALPAEGTLGILRLYLPAQKESLMLDWIAIKPTQGKPQRWSFDK